MLFYYIYFLTFAFNALSFLIHKNADCNNCKWFFLPKGKREEYGLCKFFGKNDINNIINKTKVFQYEFAEHCRKNPFMCGNNGYLFEEKEKPIVKNHIKDQANDDIKDDIKDQANDDIKDEKINRLESELFELKNKVYGEVNETYDLDKIEEEIKLLMRKLFILTNSLKNKNNDTETIFINDV
jgi:hypothetical protein